ncbi:MAG: M48 family metallopeptidase [Candidatus Peribacteria bacterium]|jgi:predicted metal-dependent hydrolase|nr:M48 family metallopeptidase [Candidatus Peribacteria bacterium]
MKIIKSFRKTITLRIDNSGEVILKAPHFTSKERIIEFIEKHKDWIEKRRQEFSKNNKTFKE